jgi:hypothetical protein
MFIVIFVVFGFGGVFDGSWRWLWAACGFDSVLEGLEGNKSQITEQQTCWNRENLYRVSRDSIGIKRKIPYGEEFQQKLTWNSYESMKKSQLSTQNIM